MKAKVIGIGAAGNKAAISLIEEGIMESSNIMLLNTTLKDIPDEYKSAAIKFSDSFGGCGKEPNIAKDLMITALEHEQINLDRFFDPEDSMVIIVNSSEGGTGCGASNIVGKYCKEVLKINVHMFVFTGFEEDGRGLLNTVQYFQNLSEDFAVEAISNKSFLDIYGSNKPKAEKDANIEFCKRVRSLIGTTLLDSAQNIDETDLYKLTTTPGFMTIESASLDKCKNIEMYNKVISDMLDNSHSLECNATCKRMGVIFNITDKTTVDYTHKLLKERLGKPFEAYLHIQDNKALPEMVTVIASGIDMPIDEVTAIYSRYIEESKQVNKSKDGFFGNIAGMASEAEDKMFDLKIKSDSQNIESKKSSFFKSLSSTDDDKKPSSNSKPSSASNSKREVSPIEANY